MPSYNTGKYINDSIESVINQTYSNWELIIVDDCSSDNTYDCISGFCDDRIKLIKNEKNSGAAESRNKALRETKGRWIAFLDSDDIWYPQKLEHQLSFMIKNGYAFSYTEYQEMNSDGEDNGRRVSGPRKITQIGMLNYCWPGCLTVMYDSDAIGLIQIANIPKNNDYAMWLQISKKANCYLLKETLAKYRRDRSGSVSTHGIGTKIIWHYRLFRYAEQESISLSFWHTVRNLFFGLMKKIVYVKRRRK